MPRNIKCKSWMPPFASLANPNPGSTLFRKSRTPSALTPYSQPVSFTISLMEVVNWRLHADGTLSAMVAEENDPVQTGAPRRPMSHLCSGKDHFRYFFQHGIANKLKERDPEALAAVAMWRQSGKGSEQLTVNSEQLREQLVDLSNRPRPTLGLASYVKKPECTNRASLLTVHCFFLIQYQYTSASTCCFSRV